MKSVTILLTMVSALLLQTMPATAQREVPLRMIRADKPTTELTLLDKIESDTRRKVYQYNEYGYITSVMEYSKGAKEQTWQLNTDESYIQDFTFDSKGRCTSRIKYNVDSNGNKNTVINKGEVVVEDGLVWERYYDTDYNGVCHLDEAYAYDQWGNKVIEVEYDYDEYDEKEYIREYTERKYTGPVDTYAAHCQYNNIRSSKMVYELEASEWYERSTNVNSLRVSEYKKTEWQTIGNKLYMRTYCEPMESVKVGELENRMVKESEIEYTLNADGTRPVSAIIRAFDIYSDNEARIENTYSFEWDDLGRLTGQTIRSGSSSEIERTEQYTYADNYARQLTAQEAAIALEIGVSVSYFPEDYYLRFGRISTASTAKMSNNNWDDATGKNPFDPFVTEEYTFVWDAYGHLTGGTWTETGQAYDYDTDKTYQLTEKGEIRVGYNADGHMAWMIDHDESGWSYDKEEYVYNSSGMWIGFREYSGDSFDGPWTLQNESIGDFEKSHRRNSRAARKSPAFIDDLSEGYHHIEYNDGIWESHGGYYVEEGVVKDGRLEQYLISSASIPSNPENNYTDPLMPLAIEEDMIAFRIEWWRYYWSVDDNDWLCEYAPDHDNRVYVKDGNIVCDQYNSNKEIVSTTTYYRDSEGRLIEERYSQGGGITYEYLSGTDNYLLESVQTDADGTRHVCHYYYSKHHYVEPTGISDVDALRKPDDKCYDLQGRLVSSPSVRGIYIINGKKVVK